MGNTDSVSFQQSGVIARYAITDGGCRISFRHTVDGNRRIRTRANRNGVILQIDVEGNIGIVAYNALCC